jgi:hypothetical protein
MDLLTPLRLLAGSEEPDAVGFPNGINRERQAGKMAQLTAGQANVFQLVVIEAMQFEKLLTAAPIADELAQG